MYSPQRHKINDDDINRTDSEEQEDISEEDDSWDQVLDWSPIFYCYLNDLFFWPINFFREMTKKILNTSLLWRKNQRSVEIGIFLKFSIHFNVKINELQNFHANYISNSIVIFRSPAIVVNLLLVVLWLNAPSAWLGFTSNAQACAEPTSLTPGTVPNANLTSLNTFKESRVVVNARVQIPKRFCLIPH